MEKSKDTKKVLEEVKVVGSTGPEGPAGATGATGATGKTGPAGTAGKVTVTSEEPGVVLTGTIAQAFEARILASVQKLFFTQFVLLMIMFVFLFGLSIIITRLTSTVNNTDKIVTAVAGPEAQEASQKAQAKVVEDLLKAMNCSDQKNLQRAIDNLVPNAKSIVDKECLKET